MSKANKVSKEQIEKICQLYIDGMGSYNIAKIINLNHATISKILLRENIPIRYQKQLVEINPFKDLSNSEVQYWLGWIVTDGNLHDKRITLTTTEKDRDVASNYCKFLNITEDNIKITDRKGEDWDLRLTIRFGHKETYEFLKSIGITEKKSLIVNPLVDFTDSFVRGLIEGDGFISTVNQPKIAFSSSSKELIEKFSNYLKSNEIKHSINQDKKCINSHWKVEIVTKQCLKLINLIYPENCNLYCNRKFERAQKIKKYYEQKGKSILYKKST